MNRIPVLVIDEDKSAVDILVHSLRSNCSDFDVVASSTSVDEIEGLLDFYRPHIVFIDFRLAKKIHFNQSERNEFLFETVVLIKSDDLLVNNFFGLHYIKKPFRSDELIEITLRLKNKFLFYFTEQSNTLITKENDLRLMLPDTLGFKLVNIDDLMRCEADGCYTKFYFNNGKRMIISKPLSNFIDQLPRDVFCRVHSKHLVNLNFVQEYIKGRGGKIRLQDDTHIDVSERKKKEFIEKLKKIAYSLS